VKTEHATWKKGLRERERTARKKLEDAARKADRDRAASHQKIQQEYTQLEARLRTAISDVEARERKLDAAEFLLTQHQVDRLTTIGQREKKVRADLKSQLNHEKQRQALLEEELNRLEAENRKAQQAAEVQTAKESPELEDIRAQVVEMRAQRDVAMATTDCVRALHVKQEGETQLWKDKTQRLARALRRQKAEVEAQQEQSKLTLRVEAGIREGVILSGDRDVLAGIRKNLHELRDARLRAF